MTYRILFIFAFFLSVFSETIEPGPFENGDYFSYQIIFGDLEYHLKHNKDVIKKCYNSVKADYHKIIEDFGWEFYRILDKNVFVGLGRNKKEKDKITEAVDILRKGIAKRLKDDYITKLWTEIQAVHYDVAAVHVDKFRDVVRENFDDYKRIMQELKKLNVNAFNPVEGRLKGARNNVKLMTDLVARNLTTCIKNEKCKTSST